MNLCPSRSWISVLFLTIIVMLVGCPAVRAVNHNEEVPASPPSFEIPIDQSSGAKYRKIALNGAPLPDEKPQQEEETDQDREETYIDALTLNLRHDTTDSYSALPASDLAVSVRRSAVSETWNLRSGLRPGERPDRPFGEGWSSNLAPNIHFTYVFADRDYYASPDTAVVTDENGTAYTFAILYEPNAYWNPDTKDFNGMFRYVPMPSSRHDHAAFQTSLEKDANGRFIFKRKYGTTLVYDSNMAVRFWIDNDRIEWFQVVQHDYCRLLTATDRYGNSLSYAYGSGNTLIPSTISDARGVQLTITNVGGTRVSSITDARGKTTSYGYSPLAWDVPFFPWNSSYSHNMLLSILSTVTAPDGAVTSYTYENAIEENQHPDRNREPQLHFDLASITDPLGRTHAFAYGFDQSNQNFYNGLYYNQTGLARPVTRVTLPTSATSNFFSFGSGRLGMSMAAYLLEWIGERRSTVIDARGNTRVYHFGDPKVEVMQSFQVKYGYEKFDAPRIVFFRENVIESYEGSGSGMTLLGTERFAFAPEAGMALTRTTDFSNNQTSFAYTDDFKSTLLVNYYLEINAFDCFDDPNSQTDANGKTKRFTYGLNRTMTSVTDEVGTVTRYRLDSEARPVGVPADHHSDFALPFQHGRRISETITDVAGTVVSHTTYDFYDTYMRGGAIPSGLSRNFVTRKIVHKLASASGDPAWTQSLVTEYIPNAAGRVWKEIVDPDGLALTTEYTYDANGNKLTSKDPRGNLTAFVYDDRNRLASVTYADATTKQFFYDARGNKVKEIDENGVATLREYDVLNRVTRQAIDMNGNAAIDPGTDLITVITYNPLNAKETVIDPKGTVTKFEYDPLQRLVKKTNDFGPGRFNDETTYDYGANAGGTIFDGSGWKPTKATDPRGYTTEVTYDKLYRPVQEKVQYSQSPGLYAITAKSYDAVGNLLTVTDPLGTITRTGYDALRRPVTIKEAYGLPLLEATTTQAYTSTGLAWKKIDPLTRETTTEYDAVGRPVKVFAPAVVDSLSVGTTPVPPVTETIYDAGNNVAAVINPLRHRTDYTYDVRNRRIAEQQPAVVDAASGLPLRPIRTTIYDAVGNATAVEDARGHVTETIYDPARRPLTIIAPLVTGPNGVTAARPVITTTYDAGGNILTVTDANGHVTVNTYDALGRLLTTTQSPTASPAADIVVTNEYDPAGNRTAVIDGKARRTEFTYDGLNRNLTVKDPANHAVTFDYDALNKIARVDSENQRTEYIYDARHRLTDVVYVGRTADNRTYAYDAASQLRAVTEPGKTGSVADVAYTYDALGRQVTELSNGKTHAYAYDLANNRITVTYGGTGTVLTSTYDVLNRLATLTEDTRVAAYGYDLNGNQVYQKLPNGEETETIFDALNRRTAIVTTKSGGGTLLELQQIYDWVGNVVRIFENYPGSTLSDRMVTNSYDGVDRLVSEVNTEGPKAIATFYTFDQANNRSSRSVITLMGDDSEIRTAFYVYNSLNQLLTATEGTTVTMFTYDLNGNRQTAGRQLAGVPAGTDTYAYDYENRLVGLDKNIPVAGGGDPGPAIYAYVYDYRTRRVERKEAGAATQLVFSGGVSVSEYLGGTPSVASAEYIRGSDWGGGVGGLLYSVRSGVPSFKHYNSRGDVISETNTAGAATWEGTYEAFGTRTQEVGSTQDRQKANTKEEDPTGLLNEGFRYRDLETGVFITRDPLGFVDGPNMYAYVVQNPWSKFDPEGLTTMAPPQVTPQEVAAAMGAMRVLMASSPGYTKLIPAAALVALGGAYVDSVSYKGHVGMRPSDFQCNTGGSPTQTQRNGLAFTVNNDDDADALATATRQRINGNHAGAEATLRNRENQRSASTSTTSESAKDAQKTSVYQRDDGYIGITNDFDRRQKEWAREGHSITELHQTPDRETARGVEQHLTEEGRAKGNEANKKQNNSIDPSRTDERANRMREKGREFLDKNKKKEDN